MSIEIIYSDVPPKERLSYSGNGQGFSITRILNVDPDSRNLVFASLEPGDWVLDGSRDLIRPSVAPRFWGAILSDSKGELSQPAVVEATFSSPCTASGTQIAFCAGANQWCSRITLRWYRGNALLAEQTLYPEGVEVTVQKLVRDFDRLTVSMEKTSQPYRFPKLEMLRVGLKHTFTGENLVGITTLQEHDPTLCRLSSDTVTAEIYHPQQDIDPREGHELQLYENGKLLRRHTVTDSRRSGIASHVITAQTMAGALEGRYLGDFYDGLSAGELLTAVLFDTGYNWTLDKSFEDFCFWGYLPVCTRREALQQMAFAMGARVEIAGNTVSLLPPETKVTALFSPGSIFAGSELQTQNTPALLEVTAHSYTPVEQLETVLDNVYVNGEDVLFLTQKPYYSYVITGGQLRRTGANHFHVTAQGNVTVKGKPLAHTAQVHSRELSGSGGTLTVDSVTLVDPYNVQQVLDRLAVSAGYRQKLTQQMVLQQQYAGQLVASPTPWNTTVQGYLTAVETTLTAGGKTGRVSILGTEYTMEDM